MEEINYLFVKIKGVQPTISFLKVIALQTNDGLLHTDKVLIEQYLFGHTMVCTGKLPSNNSSAESIYRIQLLGLTKAEDEEKYPFIKIGKFSVLPQLVSIPNLSLSSGFIDLDDDLLSNYLKTVTITSNQEFYLHQSNNLVGPFKYERGEIIPKTSKEVHLFPYDQSLALIDHENSLEFYLDSIKGPIGTIDCMNRTQLIEFFKSKVAKSQEEKELFNRIKQYIDIR